LKLPKEESEDVILRRANTIKLPKEKGQKYKQWPTKYYTGSQVSTSTSPVKNGGESCCFGKMGKFLLN
jgi:hypothetical protein